MKLLSILAASAAFCIAGQAYSQEFQLSLEEQRALMGDEVSMEVINQAAEHGKAMRKSRVVSNPRLRTRKAGNLLGKRISLSPGHGIEPGTPWAFQRQPGLLIREDKHTYEWVNEFLRPMLERAGAETLMMRAYSFTESSIQISNKSTDSYVETGSWQGSSYGDYRFAYAGAEETATATWSFNVEKDGYYPVYVRYYTSDNRVNDAQFTVSHARGDSIVLQNQNLKGIKSGSSNGTDITNNSARVSTNAWHYLGTFPFKASETGKVTLSNKSAQDGLVVISDAVQVGDGPGTYKASGGSVSGYFKWQESAQTWFRFLGIPDWVAVSDVKGRNLYSLYEGVDAQLSLHTNAGTGSGRGTQTYVWYPAKSDGNLQWVQEGSWPANFAKDNLPPGTYEYATHIHQRFRDYMNKYVESGWSGYSKLWSACFGELSPARNAWYNNKNNSPIVVPSVLIETAFHDNSSDAALIADLDFRFYGARGIMAGIIQYFKGDDAVIPPLPPNKLTVTADTDHLNLSWSPVSDSVLTNSEPTSYNIYTSDDGVLFDVDPLLNVTDSKAELPISPGQTIYVRITAVNSGGESLDSLVGVGRLPRSGQKKVLYVDGIDRQIKNYYDVNNQRSYARVYAPAISFNYPGSGLDFADDEAAPELLSTHSYDAVIWSTGETSVKTDVLPQPQKDAIKTLRSQSTPLVISGSEFAYALAKSTYNSDTTLLAQTFNVEYAADNAYDTEYAEQAFTGPDFISGSIPYSSCVADGGKVSNPGKDAYCVNMPDVLKAANGGTVVMNYVSCTQPECGAAVLSADRKSLFAGFPLETITDPDKRLCTIANLLSTVMGDEINSTCTPAVWTPPAEAREICGNQIDDDENGLKDCDDPACSALDECQTTEPHDPPVESQEICNNQIDDDNNGLTDCSDPACSSFDACLPDNPLDPPESQEICGNQIDDDNNGLTDCSDPACSSLAACSPNPPSNPTDGPTEICDNKLDDDMNGLIDCNDPVCFVQDICQNPPSNPGNPNNPSDPGNPNNPGDPGTPHPLMPADELLDEPNSSDSDCSMNGGNPSGSASALFLGLLGLLVLRRKRNRNHI